MGALTDLLKEYCNQVITDEIISCQKHKWSCQRFLNNIKQQNTEQFPYVFKEEKALLYFEWMSLFKHTKGPLAGQHKEPAPIEIFIFGNIYGWYHKDTGYRRFKKMYWQVGRKNAKSQDLAIAGNYETLANNGGGKAETYCAATKTEQAKIVWEEAETILRKCKELEGKYEVKYGRIIHKATGSIMRALSKEDRKKADGFSPSTAIIDEYHAHETDEIYNIMASGMGARPDRLLLIITTAGFELNNPCFRIEYPYVSNILNPDNPIINEEYFVMINELEKGEDGELIDDIKDPKNWIKANPILASYPEGIDYLKGELQAALDVPEKMKNFLTKNMNVWVNAREKGYMDLGKWKACGVKKDRKFPELEGIKVISGVDLSTVIDLTSVGFVFPLEDEKFAVMQHSFIPEDTFHTKLKKDKVPYDLWEKQGYLTVTPGAEVDYHVVLNYIVEMYDKYKWRKDEICFDRHLATWLEHELTERKFKPVEIAQGSATLSAPLKHFRGKTYNKKIIHNNDPLLTWAIGNAISTMDSNENIKLDKSKSRERIDPIMAVINAYVRAMVNEDNRSAYEDRGARAL